MTDPKTLNVVISQSRGGPASTRVFEGGIRSALSKAPGIEVSLIPHLYDLTRDHPAIQFLSELRGDVVVLSWLYPRAAYWVLQHNGVAGDLLNAVGAGVGGAGRTSDRIICPLQLRSEDGPGAFVEEVLRIAREREETTAGEREPGDGTSAGEGLLQGTERRWYPVIDYARCVNCLECIDFCLFGVYDLDDDDAIKVASPDNCKMGCPACSRVCPQQAIMFPEYSDPAIAGSDSESIAKEKMDLSALLPGAAGLNTASDERDAALAKDAAAGMAETTERPAPSGPPSREGDELDKLIDALEDTDI